MIEPYYQADRVTLYLGDCIEVMRELPEASVDAIVTDPPYGIGFMGRAWDTFDPDFVGAAVNQHARKSLLPGRNVVHEGRAWEAGRYDRSIIANREFQAWCEAWAREAYRVLKPGAFLVAFGGTRTDHRLACGIEDAGFEIRNTVAWMFGSGFPKSKDIERAIAMELCELPGRHLMRTLPPVEERRPDDHVCPELPESSRWRGFGTDLKPGFEPARVARKPLAGNLAQNVLAHGTGALNIDGTRIGTDVVGWGGGAAGPDWRDTTGHLQAGQPRPVTGRWPANVILDEEAAALLDATVGELHAGNHPRVRNTSPDAGGPSRFFYTAKAGTTEREAGLEEFPPALRTDGRDADGAGANNPRLRVSERHNDHPTVKPVSLMRWLVRLATPPGGLILDPFMGSGSTALGALDRHDLSDEEAYRFIGIDITPRYADIARYRIEHRHLVTEPEVRPPAAAIPQGRLL